MPISDLLPRSLIGRQMLALGTILLVGNALLLQRLHVGVEEEIVRAEAKRLASLAASLALTIDVDSHERAIAALPQKDAFTTWASAPADLAQSQRQLSEAASAIGLASPVYLLRLVDGVDVAPDHPLAEALEFTLTSADTPYWRHRYGYRPEMEGALFDGEVSTSTVYRDEHGEWLSAYAPVRSQVGEIVALLEVDAPLSELISARNDRTLRNIGLVLSIMTGTLIAIIVLGRSLNRSLQDLEDAATRMGLGDMQTPVGVLGLFEVQQLAEGMEQARVVIAERERKLERLSRSLKEKLNIANEQLGALGLERRQRISRFAETLSFSMRLSGRGLNAMLLDLTDRIAVFRVEPHVRPVLGGSTTVWCHKNTEFLGALVGTLVSRTGDGPTALTIILKRQPEEVAAVLFRRPIRVRPDPANPVVCSVHAGGSWHTAEVENLSISGLRIGVGVSKAEVGRWQGTVKLRMTLPGRPMMKTTGHLRSIESTKRGVGLGLTFVDSVQNLGKIEDELQRYVLQRERALAGARQTQGPDRGDR